jgi:large subunit ribosomal protein L40
LSRLRALRHWTIHRAWQLHKANMRKQQELDLERQFNEMRRACGQLRLIGSDGMPGGPDEGKLYRIAMEKRGVWQGVPIEYARLQTEWPSRDGWNHEWTRG